ncbi:MAG: hypothetical protein K2P80_00680, partial [Beijerinckiaceae bacterium]|nr:hypothetical protein [Beijerinckiaceae bacterium]
MADHSADIQISVAQLKERIVGKLTYSLGKTPGVAKPHDWLTAGILALREDVIDVWHRSTQKSY